MFSEKSLDRNGLKLDREGAVVFESSESVSKNFKNSEGIFVVLEKGKGTARCLLDGAGIPILINVFVGKEAELDFFIGSAGKEDRELDLKILVKERGRLNIHELHQASSNLKLKNELSCERESVVQRRVANLSSGTSSIKVDCNLIGQGADFSDTEINFGTKLASAENKITINHASDHTTSLVKIRSVLTDASKGLVHANVKVEKDTAEVNTSVSAHALLLDKNASAQAIPALEIESADVQAGHSASVSTIDEEQLFYLSTRGVSLIEAKKLIVKGFLAELIEDKKISELIEEQWEKNLMLNA